MRMCAGSSYVCSSDRRCHPLHPHACWQLSLPGAVFALLLAAALGGRFGPWGLAGLLWLPWVVFVARQHARRAGYALDDRLVGARSGWWSRRWRYAEIDKLQAMEVRQAPLVPRQGKATLWLDRQDARRAGEALVSKSRSQRSPYKQKKKKK